MNPRSHGPPAGGSGVALEGALAREPHGERIRGRIAQAPLLEALVLEGTAHVYVDTADEMEIAPVALTDAGELVAEIDGNTINQPLAAKVLRRHVDGPLADWLGGLRPRVQDSEDLAAWAYAAVNVRMAHEIVERFGAGRTWEASLQLHMDLPADPRRALAVGSEMRRVVPQTLVKVPFQPQHPQSLLAARDLERAGVPVNLTSTFSARQVAIAALLVGATRTNVFMGRIDQGMSARLLGEHTALEAQRMLLDLRARHELPTRLILASFRDWHALVRTAGCDVYTVPPGILREFLTQEEIAPDEIESRLETSYEHELGIADATLAAVPSERLARLYRVEPELLEFLFEYRGSREFAELADGDQLVKRFDAAGFGDVFHAPSASERRVLDAGKVPDLASPLPGRIALDTLFTLHADADFRRHQTEMDAVLAAAGARG